MKKIHGLALLGGVATVGFVLFSSSGETEEESAAGTEATEERVRPTDLHRYSFDRSDSSGVALYSEGRFSEALEALTGEIDGTSGRDRARSLYCLGLCRMKLDDARGARATWDRLRSEHPDSPYAGDSLWREAQRIGGGSAVAAHPMLTEAMEKHPGSFGGQSSAMELALYFEQRGRNEEASLAWSVVLRGPQLGEIKARARRSLIELARLSPPGADAPTYEVQRGDSLWKIARRFGTTPGFIRLINGKNSNTIRPGERLRVDRGEISIHVSKQEHLLRLFVGGRFVLDFPVGLGADGSTPVGQFRIANKKENPDWYYGGNVIPFGDPRNILGSRWMGFENRPGVEGYGIHGTSRPESIGFDESSGCIRMYNHDVESLFDLVPVGASVAIDS